MSKRNKLGLAVAYVSAFGAASTSVQSLAEERLLLEEVVVTARMREESLQSTPLSITALSGDLLANRNISDVRALLDQTPGVYFTNQGGPGLGNVSMRGLSQGSLIGDESNVASFIDGFYWSGRIAFDGFLDGLERVEVVRGPQSALYGRNSFAGAINYITKKPDMEEMHGGAKVTVGESDRLEVSGNITFPVVEDKLAVRIDASSLETGGTWKNSVNGERLNNAESDNLRIAFKAQPSNKINMDYAYTYIDRETSDQPLYGIPLNELDSGYKADFITFSFRNHKIQNPEPRPSSDLDRHVSDLIGSSYAVDRHTFRFDYEFEKFVASALIAHTDEELSNIVDASYGTGGDIILANIFDLSNPSARPTLTPVDLNGDSIPDSFPVVGGQPNQDREDFSGEIRLQSRTAGPWSWEVGGFYSELEYTSLLRDGYDVSEATLAAASAWTPGPFPLINAGIIPATYNCNFMDPASCPRPMVLDTWGVEGGVQILQEKFFKNEETSIFASVGYQLSDRTSIQIEARQTWEDRYLEDRKEVTRLFDNSFDEPISADYSNFTPRVIVDHQLTEDVFLYAVVGKGAKAGGVQPSQSAGGQFYDPEENWTYEAGAKMELLDGRMNLNVSAFYIDWTDMQLRENVGLENIVTNLGKAEVIGFEVMGAYKVHKNVQMRYGYTYQDGEITEGSIASAAGFCDIPNLEHIRVPISFGNPAAFDPVAQEKCDYQPDPTFATAGSISVSSGDISGNRISNAPESNFVYGLDVNVPVNDRVSAFATLDVNYRSETYLDFHNWIEIGSTTLVNAQFGVQTDNWRVSLWAENMTDEDTVIAAINNFNILGQSGTQVQHRNGRVYGLTLSADF